LSTSRRLAVARIWHEANAFSPLRSGLAGFRQREWQAGATARQLYRGTATEMGAAVAFLDARRDWEGVFLRCTSAPPGGPVEQEVLDTIIDEIVSGLDAGKWDAVYVSLHGATAGTIDLGPDYTLLARIRAAVGRHVPVAVTFDMHACLDPRIADVADIIVGYKSYPHVDMFATAAKALALLDAMAQGKARYASVIAPVPMLPQSHGMRTDAEPMCGLVRLAAQTEAKHGLGDVTMFGGFAYADTPWTSSAVTVCFEERDEASRRRAEGLAGVLGAAMKSRHGQFVPSLPSADEGLAQARRLIESGSRWPVAVLENADNPLSGGGADTPTLFRALVEMGPPWPVLFASFFDPDLVARAHALGVGARIEAEIGGRLDPSFGLPVPFSGKVEALSDGSFVNIGPMERGRRETIGRTALLGAGNVRVVIGETPQSVNDPAWCGLHGIDLDAVALFCAKAKNHFRAGFGERCAQVIDVDTPGPAPADLRQLPYRHVPRAFIMPS
jgi:microcystin degradation protein MlrC